MKNRIFLAHASEDKPAVRELYRYLKSYGLQPWLDEEDILPGETWADVIPKAIHECGLFIACLSRQSVSKDGYVQKEFRSALDRAVQKGADKIYLIPLKLDDCVVPPITLPSFDRKLTDFTWIDFWREDQRPRLLRSIRSALQPAEKATGEAPAGESVSEPLFTPPRVLVDCKYFTGRAEELQVLNDAWKSGGSAYTGHKRNVVTVYGFGGIGKTALVNKWVAGIINEKWSGAEGFFDWSFYREGASGHLTGSTDEFFDTALRRFGEHHPEQYSGWNKGARLAHLVRKKRILFFLDSIDTLQNSDGALTDDPLKAFLLGLAQINSGLCVITSRIAIPELAALSGTSVVVEVKKLPPHAGIDLLQQLGVTRASTCELKQAVSDLHGHPLSLTLFGRYMAVVHDGHIESTKLLEATAACLEGKHAQRIMTFYERWLRNKSASDVLHVLGLFSGPAEDEAFDVLLQEPVIEGLTDRIAGNKYQWRFAVDHLRELGLILPRNENNPRLLQCHVMVREHFTSHLRRRHLSACGEPGGQVFILDLFGGCVVCP